MRCNESLPPGGEARKAEGAEMRGAESESIEWGAASRCKERQLGEGEKNRARNEQNAF